MIIEHRGIIPERFDTPFGVGTMIWAKDCHHNCHGCFHADRHTKEIYQEDIEDLFQRVLSDPFTQGIVLGGFEWTEEYEQLLAIIEYARKINIEVILYTHYTIEEISTDYSELLNYQGIYLKCGEYDDTLLSAIYSSYGVPLASTNQKIYKVGVDISGSNLKEIVRE